MKDKPLIVVLLAVMLVVAAGCVPGPAEPANTPAPCPTCLPTSVPPTVVPMVDFQATIYAVQTESVLKYIADLTENAPTPTLTSSPSPVPSNTSPPTMTNTSTATLKPTSTLTPTQSAWGCTIIEASPEKNTSFGPNADFDARWVIKNTGYEKWLKTNVDFSYSSGEKLQKFVDTVDLNNDVDTGEEYTVLIDMRAPTTTGTYTTTWVATSGTDVICNMSVTIVVE
jgi:hypothetical protein